jgi:anti-sigma regulatory factor (Ser/Thr protein kinase)
VVLYYDGPQVFDQAEAAALVARGRQLGSALRRAQRRRGRRSGSFADDAVPPGARVADHEVPNAHRAVAGARSFLAEVLRGWEVPDVVSADAVLCLSELVTNALVHSSSGCSVRAVLDADVLTVAVRDGGVHSGPAVGPADEVLRVHGRGLQIVEAVTTRWGSDLDDRGLTVWFSLELAPGD